jgi:hypothetical protein
MRHSHEIRRTQGNAGFHSFMADGDATSLQLFRKLGGRKRQCRKRNQRKQQKRQETTATSLCIEIAIVNADPAVRAGCRLCLCLRDHGLSSGDQNTRTDTKPQARTSYASLKSMQIVIHDH